MLLLLYTCLHILRTRFNYVHPYLCVPVKYIMFPKEVFLFVWLVIVLILYQN